MSRSSVRLFAASWPLDADWKFDAFVTVHHLRNDELLTEKMQDVVLDRCCFFLGLSATPIVADRADLFVPLLLAEVSLLFSGR